MAKGPILQPVFKAYHQRQAMLLPPGLDELIAVNHPVRVVDDVLSKVDIQPLVRQYKTGGASSYHHGMLLKVLVYAYINNIYSSRKIEEALQQNIHFMWLSGMSTPDHNTINRFRGERLKELYTDGTKIEANANRYTFVWGNAIKTNKEKMKLQLDELWKYAQGVAASELDDIDPDGFDKIDKQKVEQTIAQIDAALKDKPVNKQIKQKLNYAKKHWPAALDRYEQQEKITPTGFIQTVTKYQAKNCNNCPLNGACHKSKGERVIEINHQLNKLKQQANQRLLSEEGIKKRKQRCWDVDHVFANIKNNHGFKRFMLRGKQKVSIEAGLLALAHNLRKKAMPTGRQAA